MLRLKHYLVLVGGLLLYFAVRLYHLMALPLFIDESLVIQWSEQSRSGSPLGFGYHGKYLLPWIHALFFSSDKAYWTIRVLSLLIVLLGLCATLMLAKRWANFQASSIVFALCLLTPMLHFHERMALTDTVMTALLMLYLYVLVLAFHKLKHSWAIFAACCYLACLLAKSAVLVLAPLPLVLAFLTTGKRRQRFILCIEIYAAMLLLWLPLQLVLWWRQINYFGLAGQMSSSSTALFSWERVSHNMAFVLEGYAAYFPLGFLLIIACATFVSAYYKPRPSLILLAMSLGFASALILLGGAPLYHRYWLAALPPLVLLLALAIESLSKLRPSVWFQRAIPLAFIGLWASLGLPFIWTAAFQPVELQLSHLDYQQYLEADSSGMMLPETAQWLDEHDAQAPLGAIPNCYALALYTQTPLRCIDVLIDERLDLLQSALTETFPDYLVLETNGYIQASALTDLNLSLVASFPRPQDLIRIEIYAVSR